MITYWLLAFMTLFTSLTAEIIEWQRDNGSLMQGYLTVQTTENEKFPILLMIQGSQKESVLALHTSVNNHLANSPIAILSFEKRGYDLDGNLNNKLYDKCDYFDNRIKDGQLAIDQIKKGAIPNWNGQIFLGGASEGGAVAARLAAKNPDLDGVMLFCTGGGLPFKEEILMTVRKWEKNAGKKDKEIKFKLGLIQAQILVMQAHPSTKLNFGGYTYKWWSSHLGRRTLDDIVQINSPLYYVHGTEDELLPIESADLVAKVMQNRPGFVYKRYEGVRHAIDNLIYPAWDEGINWIKEHIKY
ncbi:MAG: alpha/beta hydrolase [Parachlamydiales bacterium]|nr:alpha/beta hydrolase [Parachlamydiales bacterium]